MRTKATPHEDSCAACRPQLPRWAVTCIAGAVGECGGQFFLYPVETVKVLCQRNGTGAVPMLRKLVHEHKVAGAAARLMRGITGTMVVSALLGAAYLAIFKATTSLFSGSASSKIEAPPPPLHPPTLPAAVLVADREHADEVFSNAHSHEAQPAYSNERGVASEGASFGGVVASAMATSVAIALLTGPIEMARNRLQAGVVSGNLLTYTMSRRGLREVLPFLGPFCLTAVPHDFAELITVYVGGDTVDAVRRGAPWLRVRREVLDACVGGLAGAFGVLLSAPADCIKTKTLTMSARSAFVRAHANPQALLAAGTGAQWRAAAVFTLRAQGVGGLFVGVWPRLVDEVPGSMLHWTLVEACYRWLGASEELA